MAVGQRKDTDTKQARRVCFVLDENIYRLAGVQVYIIGLAEKLIADGHDVTILHTQNRSVPVYKLNPKIRVLDIAHGFEIPLFTPNGGVSVLPGIVSRRKIRAILAEHAFDVYHFNYPFSPLLSGKIIKEATRQEEQSKTKSKKFATFHVYAEESKFRILLNRALAYLVRKAVRQIDTFINTGKPTEMYGHKYLRVDSIHIPIGVEDDTSYVPSNNKKTVDVLFFGRLEKRKGVQEFIEALRLVMAAGLLKNVRITVAGNGPERNKAEQLAKKYGLDIRFLGTVAVEGKDDLFRQSDIVVFPTKYGEGFGIVLLEAMRHYAVAIGYANAGYQSTMKELAPKFLVKSGDVDQLAALLGSLLKKNRQELVELQILQKKFCDEHYDAIKLYKKLIQLYFSAD
ncbi:MAG: glycosyltransferase family 4 protein [Candidatus Saccharimonadales bacterium]